MSQLTRRVWDIHGGIHPAENKTQSSGQAIVAAAMPQQLVFPLSQHIGAPAKAIVAVGEHVLKGQMIAAAHGFVSAPVHASSSGRVLAIEQRLVPHPSGISAPAIVIETDGLDQWTELQPVTDYQSLEPAALLDVIRQAGIAGMGGAGFPAAVKLATGEQYSIDTLIINGTECEPYITADDRLMRERAEQIIGGCNILRHLVQPSGDTLIGIEDNKPEAIAALRAAALDSAIEVVAFPTKYPSGGEKQLIQILTGREVPSGGLPAQVGVVCQNIGTAAAIYQAVYEGRPLISRITTITGAACREPRNLEVLLGTPVNGLLQQCGFEADRCSRLVMGGPMMGFTLADGTVPVVKTTNCILAASADEMPDPDPAQACIRCGLCEQACPASLLPQQLYWFSRGKEYDKLEAHNIADCIECGACAYVCPSTIPLVQYYRASKAGIKQHREDAINAEHAKARFEARQVRIEQQEAEKVAKREARKAAAEARAAGGDGKADAVQAAIERAKSKKAAPDAAQLAIEKALSKRASEPEANTDEDSLRKTLASTEARLDKARTKLQQAEAEGADHIDALRLGVEKTEQKLLAAKKALDQFADTTVQPTAPSAGNAAADAIARALAKRESSATLSEGEKRAKAVSALQVRIEKARNKLALAQRDGLETATILAETLVKLEAKLEQANIALQETS